MPHAGAVSAMALCTSTRMSPECTGIGNGSAGGRPGLVGAVDQQAPDLLERHTADEVVDVDTAIAQRGPFLVGLGDLALERNDAFKSMVHFSHTLHSALRGYRGVMETPDLARMREEYARDGLDESAAGDDPLALLGRWLNEAIDAGVYEPNAMALATASPDGQPSVRIVLLKGLDERGTDVLHGLQSRKGVELEANPRAAAVMLWHPLQRQVRVEGDVTRIDEAESDAYFASRPRGLAGQCRRLAAVPASSRAARCSSRGSPKSLRSSMTKTSYARRYGVVIASRC